MAVIGTTVSNGSRRLVVLMLFLSFLALVSNLWLLGLGAEDTETNKTMPDRRLAKAPEETFSACLMVMDDPYWLVEWMAYHYHVMPLRDVIVLNDPKAKLSPKPVLNRWQGMMTTLEVWNETPSWETVENKPKNHEVNLYILRQRVFYRDCLLEFQRRGKQKVLVIDTDEFVRFNPWSIQSNFLNNSHLVPISEPGSILKLLNKVTPLLKQKKANNMPCFEMPRIQYGSKEHNETDYLRDLMLSSVVNASNLLTTRFLYRATKQIFSQKTFVDVSMLNSALLVNTISPGAHSPVIGAGCDAPTGAKLRKPGNVLLINHYLGTYEQYNFPDDERKPLLKNGEKQPFIHKAYENQAKTVSPNELDVAIIPWVQGFIDDVGQEKARQLLEGVGDTTYGWQ